MCKNTASPLKVGAEADKMMAGLTPRTLRLLPCSPDTDEDVDLARLIVQEGGDEGREVEGMVGKGKEKAVERYCSHRYLLNPLAHSVHGLSQ
jgi:hypothetical protein